MTLYQLLRQGYSKKELEKQFLNAVITSTAVEGVDVSYLTQEAKLQRKSGGQRRR